MIVKGFKKFKPNSEIKSSFNGHQNENITGEISSGLIKNFNFCKLCNKEYKSNNKWLLPHELK